MLGEYVTQNCDKLMSLPLFQDGVDGRVSSKGVGLHFDACQILAFVLGFLFFCSNVHFVRTILSHRNKINKLLTY